MNPSANSGAPPDGGLRSRIFPLVFGTFLGTALLKFGNPPIMEKYVTNPGDIYEFLLGSPWPIAWAYVLLALVAVFGLFCARWALPKPRWLMAMPLFWLAWQGVSSTHTVDPSLSGPTFAHFAACTACFYLGLFSLGQTQRLSWFWIPLLCAFVVVLAIGWEQHFGGLEETKRYFFLYIYPQLKDVPPEYLKKMSSTRIFSTLFYPNALAGTLLLLLPPVLGNILAARERFTPAARGFLVLVVALGALGCLYWSGSKGGWLLMLLLGLVVVLRLPFANALKLSLLTLVLLAGLAGFFWKYSSFFQKGATSVSARFDYWSAALTTARVKPIFGTGPGTFSVPYRNIKRPESEMSRLAHNDYLEQATDSGVPGFLAYTSFIVGALAYGAPRRRTAASLRVAYPSAPAKPVSTVVTAPSKSEEPHPQQRRPELRSLAALLGRVKGMFGPGVCPNSPSDRTMFLAWLGVLGWALQGLVEFGLYQPSLAWPAFAFIGLLLATTRNPIDKSGQPR